MPGTVIKKSYVSSVSYGSDGKPHRESYQSQSVKQVDKEGHKIQEKQMAYKNTKSGIERASHQKMLDTKGHRIVRERNRNTGEEQEHNIYRGFNEGMIEW